MKKPNPFCSRKGGAVIKDKFYPIRTSDILARQLERQNNKMSKRRG
jgi:hypothetical protein